MPSRHQETNQANLPSLKALLAMGAGLGFLTISFLGTLAHQSATNRRRLVEDPKPGQRVKTPKPYRTPARGGGFTLGRLIEGTIQHIDWDIRLCTVEMEFGP